MESSSAKRDRANGQDRRAIIKYIVRTQGLARGWRHGIGGGGTCESQEGTSKQRAKDEEGDRARVRSNISYMRAWMADGVLRVEKGLLELQDLQPSRLHFLSWWGMWGRALALSPHQQ